MYAHGPYTHILNQNRAFGVQLEAKPSRVNEYFETEEEAMEFDEANFDAPVPEYFMYQNAQEDDSTTSSSDKQKKDQPQVSGVNKYQE